MSDYSLCNSTWHVDAVARFCAGSAFNTTTVGDLARAQRWPRRGTGI